MKRLVESVPNLSEGRDLAKVDAIIAAMREVPGVYLLDRESDADHNRSVVTIEDCVALAKKVGREIWERYRIPVYFYEAAAQRPERSNLENIRKGQFEG